MIVLLAEQMVLVQLAQSLERHRLVARTEKDNHSHPCECIHTHVVTQSELSSKRDICTQAHAHAHAGKIQR